MQGRRSQNTLPSSEPEAIKSSLKGFLSAFISQIQRLLLQHPPVSVQHSRSVPAEEGDLVWQLSSLIERNDSKSTTTSSFPVDSQVFGVDLIAC